MDVAHIPTNRKFNPPLRQNGIEVTAIHENLHTIHCVLFINPLDVGEVNPDIIKQVADARIHSMLNYLEKEDWIASPNGWISHTGIVMLMD